MPQTDILEAGQERTEKARRKRWATKRSPGLYFVGPLTDTLFMGGASLLVFALFLCVPQIGESPRVLVVTATVAWICNFPHFTATSYRLYHSGTSIRQYPMTAFLTPVVMVAAVAACFASPDVVAPEFILLYMLWSPYHYSGQTIGLTMVYARRARVDITGPERKAFVAFIMLTFAATVARYQSGTTEQHFYGVSYTPLGLPGWAPALLETAMWASAAVLAFRIVFRRFDGRPPFPLIVLVPAVTQYIWFMAAPPGYYLAVIPIFHALQYLFVAWNVQLKESIDVAGRKPSVRFAVTESGRWLAVIVALGFILFWLLPRLGAQLGHSLAFSTAIIFVALQIHHFFVDGVIWKLRSPKAASPLSSSLWEITGKSPAAAAVRGDQPRVACPDGAGPADPRVTAAEARPTTGVHP